MMNSQHPAVRGTGGLVPSLLALVTVLGSSMSTKAEPPPLIPRDVLFGNPEKSSPQIAPDGKRLAWIAPDKKNVLQVWVRTIGKDDDKVVTADPKRGIRQFFWAQNSKMLIYSQDSDGDENFHLFGVDLTSGNVRDLTPIQGVKAQVTAIDPNFPDTILVSLNARDRSLFDVYRLDLNTGALALDTVNPGDVMGWTADPHLQVRAAQASTPDGGIVIRVRDESSSEFRKWLEAGPEDALTLHLLDFTADGKSVYLISALGRDTAALVKKTIAGGSDQELAASSEADADSVLIHPKTHVAQAVRFSPGRSTWTVIDPSVQADFDGIARLHEGDFSVIDRDQADKTWLVAYHLRPRADLLLRLGPRARKGTFLFVHQPKLQGLALAEMKPVSIKARDGLNLRRLPDTPRRTGATQSAAGFDGSRRTVGPGYLGIQSHGPVVRQPWLRRACRSTSGHRPGMARRS